MIARMLCNASLTAVLAAMAVILNEAARRAKIHYSRWSAKH